MSNLNSTSNYEKQKLKLNPEQRDAIESIEGPVMVLAGPGTGKTQVLAFRIAEILTHTQINPRNILALTFTESGVLAMRERLVSLAGVDAYGVAIYTFHGFANRIIAESGAEFYQSHTLDPIDEISQLKLVLELIDQQDNTLLRPIRSPHFFVTSILQAIKSLKNESVTPDALRELCQQSIIDLTNDPDSISKSGKTKGEIKQSVKDRIARLERTIALGQLYDRYNQELTKRGLYDYEDMILFVLKKFETNPELKARYQEQFQYILVDEYQDTNNTQNRLIQILGDYFDNPNIFVVGDDKQSIYRFQGASMANLLNFRDWFPQAKIISLRHNYRSGQSILDNAQSLIEHNSEQLGSLLPSINTKLIANHANSTINYTHYATQDKENTGIIEEIKRLIAAGTKASSIAIIYRQNNESQPFCDELARNGIGYYLPLGDNILKDQDTRHLVNMLELARNPDDEFALWRYFHAPYSGATTTDTILASRWRKDNRATWLSLFQTCPENIEQASWQRLKNIKIKTEEWHRFSVTRNLGDVVEFIFRDSGLLEYIMSQPDHLERLHRIRCFFDEVKHIMSSEHYATLDNLFERISIRQKYNLPLICQPMVERSDDAVRLMTAHKSKGLEFDYVFIPNFRDELWSNRRAHDQIALPEGIVSHHKITDEQNIEEERRLFYVALTRAKKDVYLSSAEFSRDGKKYLPSQFLNELSSVVLTEPKPISESSLAVFASPIDQQFHETTTRAYLLDIVQSQPITPTGLNTFLTCPLEYLYKDVYCVPGVREPYQAYGTAIHKALEMWGKWSKENNKNIELKKILNIFGEALIKEGLTKDEVKSYQKLGHEVLTAYWERMASSWTPPLAVEYSFTPHNVLLDSKIPITGKLDKIEPISDSKLVRVVDYKTGRIRSRNEIEGKTNSSDADYKRQLVFYTILAEQDPTFPFKIGEVALSFIDDDKRFTTEIFTITNDEREELKSLIRHIHAEITALNFPHTPHKKRYGQDESLCELLHNEK